MSIASQARRPKAPAHNSSKRPRLYGFLSTPEPFDFTAWQDQAHKANRLALTHAKGSGLGFGGAGCQLSGLPARQKRARRKRLRLRNWMRRDAARREAGQAFPKATPAAEPVAATAPAAGVVGKVAGKVSRFFGRVFGRKGGR